MIVKGFKGMEADMTCRGMQFEVGKSYHVDGDISVCWNGIHFCERLNNVFSYYPRDGNRFFEVEATGTIKTEGGKSATSDIKIIRELSDVEINRTHYGNGCGHGTGCGWGNGCGYGDGYLCGGGSGSGFGFGYGYGDGYLCGGGSGSGFGFGYGNRDADGIGIGNCHGYGNIQKVLLFV